MSTFTLLATYAAGHTDISTGLSARQLEQGLMAFGGDLAHLEGKGITRLEVFIEGIVPTPRVDVMGKPVLIEAADDSPLPDSAIEQAESRNWGQPAYGHMGGGCYS